MLRMTFFNADRVARQHVGRTLPFTYDTHMTCASIISHVRYCRRPMVSMRDLCHHGRLRQPSTRCVAMPSWRTWRLVKCVQAWNREEDHRERMGHAVELARPTMRVMSEHQRASGARLVMHLERHEAPHHHVIRPRRTRQRTEHEPETMGMCSRSLIM